MFRNANKTSLAVYLSLFLLFFLLIVSNSFSHIRPSISDRFYGEKTPLDNIIIIKIDDSSINKIGRWPWDRNIFSEILLKIKNAKVIGIDVSFFEESKDDSTLINTLKSFNNTVLAAEVNEDGLMQPIFDSDFGYVNLITDSDGITRSVETGLYEKTIPFSFGIYKKYSGKEDFEIKKYIINYASGHGSFNSISAYELLEGANLDARNKIVLIGATAPDLRDTFFVPTSKGTAMPGVEIHANIIQNLILNNFLKKQGKISTLFLVLIFSFLSFFILSRLKIYYIIPIILLTIIFYSLIGIYLFNNFDYIIDLFFFPLSVLTFTGAGIAVNYIEEEKHSAYLREAFGKYVSKNLLSEIINKSYELKLGGSKKEITIFFSDIRGFTSISEKLNPEELVNLMNDYLTKMTEIILENNGTVDKFIGDAVMAFWNAPFNQEDHAELACKSAVEQINSLKKFNKDKKNQGYPEINIGIGINTGEAITGNMGSEERFDYTAMGDSVNLASRLEGLTKQYGVNIIISESTKKQIKNKFDVRKLDRVKVKGKKIPITIYELITNKKFGKLTEQYEKALELYFDGRFKKAKAEFNKALNINKKNKASMLFLQRCKEYIKNPPAKNWDGSFEVKTK
ncbi:MAG: adenylate/guanylate cyclase domain-containing protein [Nanoarchaeota archaeon]|nr:adenylate/guanylate cyclase domain-containing protein [Nanoarchaeota archaeon]